jgi:flagellar biosynthesis protein FlhB
MAEKDERIHEPTPRKLEQAREKGDIVYSPEVGSALSLAALTAAAAFMAGPIFDKTGKSLIGFIAMPAQMSAEPSALVSAFAAIGLRLMVIFGFVALAFAAAGLISRYLQDKPTFNGEKLSPKLEKLNPVEGFKRVFGETALATFLKSVAKLVFVGAVLAWALWPQSGEIEEIGLLDPAALMPYIQDRAVAMLMALASASAFLAGIDYLFTRQAYMKRQRMSPQELKQEFRESTGDPMVRAKLQSIRNERAKRRMLQNMGRASVVITNPTHYAVALRYEPGETAAPICLAKGVDAVAQRIREAAEEHGVPIVENPPLARALFATADIDAPIPAEHYQAVAKVIGFVMRLSRRGNRRPAPRGRP